MQNFSLSDQITREYLACIRASIEYYQNQPSTVFCYSRLYFLTEGKFKEFGLSNFKAWEVVSISFILIHALVL